jgi:hypothetical protein
VGKQDVHDDDDKIDDDDDDDNGGLRSGNIPHIALPDLNKTNDLLNRLNDFLPKFQASNQTIANNEKEKLQVDGDLESDHDSDSDDDAHGSSDDDDKKGAPAPSIFHGIEEVDSSDNHESIITSKGSMVDDVPDQNEKSGSRVGPTIQLQFAVGDMTGNPMMKLLAGSDDDEEEEDDDDDKGNGANDSARTNGVAKLLLSSHTSNGTSMKMDTTTKGENILSKKKPLITEL